MRNVNYKELSGTVSIPTRRVSDDDYDYLDRASGSSHSKLSRAPIFRGRKQPRYQDANVVEGSTELMIAAVNGKIDDAERILGSGNQVVDAKDAQGFTAVMIAAENGEDIIVECLLNLVLLSMRRLLEG